MSVPAILRDRSRLFDVRLWVGAALLLGVLLRLAGAGGASRLWFLDPLLLGGFLFAVVRLGGNGHVPGRGGTIGSAAAFIALGWTAGMLYELTLSAGGGLTFGGLLPQTLPSFALAQGFYFPFAIFGYLLVRRTDVSLRTLYFATGAVSVFEMITTGSVVSALASPYFLLVPLLLAYYFSVYAMFVCWPVAVFGVDRFRGRAPRHVSTPRAIAWMLAAGALSWLIFGAWGALLGRLAPGFVGAM